MTQETVLQFAYVLIGWAGLVAFIVVLRARKTLRDIAEFEEALHKLFQEMENKL